MLTVADVADVLEISRSTVTALIGSGKLRAVNTGNRRRNFWRVHEADLLEFVHGAESRPSMPRPGA